VKIKNEYQVKLMFRFDPYPGKGQIADMYSVIIVFSKEAENKFSPESKVNRKSEASDTALVYETAHRYAENPRVARPFSLGRYSP
jgi:hypothetical protein